MNIFESLKHEKASKMKLKFKIDIYFIFFFLRND